MAHSPRAPGELESDLAIFAYVLQKGLDNQETQSPTVAHSPNLPADRFSIAELMNRSSTQPPNRSDLLGRGKRGPETVPQSPWEHQRVL